MGEERMRGEEKKGSRRNSNDNANLTMASTDEHLTDILLHIRSSKTPAVINYGASWCRICNQILPVFRKYSKVFPKLGFVYADIDECPETTLSIRYTPTFQFYRDGERVDEMFGAGEERLHDLQAVFLLCLCSSAIMFSMYKFITYT